MNAMNACTQTYYVFIPLYAQKSEINYFDTEKGVLEMFVNYISLFTLTQLLIFSFYSPAF